MVVQSCSVVLTSVILYFSSLNLSLQKGTSHCFKSSASEAPTDLAYSFKSSRSDQENNKFRESKQKKKYRIHKISPFTAPSQDLALRSSRSFSAASRVAIFLANETSAWLSKPNNLALASLNSKILLMTGVLSVVLLEALVI